MLQTDQNNRELAIDPTKSFIIEAPAGSGKTSLLIQRYLVLLTTVKNPEEIIAITFTRKAATEMRSRILTALNTALYTPAPQNTHKLKLWRLATAALKHDQKHSWHLTENPNRLRIQTIDSFCNQLAKKSPLSSGLGANLNILQDQELFQCYRKAVKYLFNNLSNSKDSQDLRALLLHLDNDYAKAEDLLMNMLARRDQWLPHIINHNEPKKLRAILERSLNNAIYENLINCQKCFTAEVFAEIQALTQYATSLIIKFDSQESWQEIAKLLLTQKFQWRKTVNTRCGFPSAATATSKAEQVFFKTMKQRMDALLAQLADFENARKTLEAFLHLPPAQYSDRQWEIVLSLINVLKKLAICHLPQALREHQAVDYIEIALAAERALDMDAPDYLAQHILVDEFQDTSITQYRLLEKLTANWQSGDGRTLFLVGDPMQSIYKFREAKVGLFLRTKKQQRINSVSLSALTLSANFRSDKHIINWVNSKFVKIFPKHENIGHGAVTFIPSTATNNINLPQNIKLYSFTEQDHHAEAKNIVTIIQQTQELDPAGSIAILVRSRNHLMHIISGLKQAGIIYQAVELEALSSSPVIKDLFALTRALLNLSDQIAWLSILRAPWCGLVLADLHALVEFSHGSEKPLWSALVNYQQLHTLSHDAKTRLAYIVPILANALALRSQKPLRQWIKKTWIELNGDLYLNNCELETAERYFNLLAMQDNGGYIEDLNLFAKQLDALYADSQHIKTKSQVQIMTIHKAKGLEFDTVIIPALERKLKASSQELLMWAERPNAFDSKCDDLIFAPITEIGQELDPIYNYLQYENQQKEYHELSRLLYVAITRAKKRLHLSACINSENPSSGSLLEQLWPWFTKPVDNMDTENIATKRSPIMLARLPADVFYSRNPSLRASISERGNPENLKLDCFTSLAMMDFSHDFHNSSKIGIIIHDCLRYLSTIDLNNWLETNLKSYRQIWRTKLMQIGIFENIDAHVNIIANAIKITLEDPKGRWVLDRNHQEARSEYSLTVMINSIAKNFIIDRTFVEHNNRWIIDYKTSHPNPNEDLGVFFNKQRELHQKQLQHYANIIKHIDNRSQRMGLYFPMLGKFLELSY